MTRRERLQEQYEDALFALMMDSVATAEGEKLLEENERLKNDPEAAVPEEISRQCLRTIRKIFTKQKVRTAGRFTARAFGKIAMAAGVAAMLFTAAFATSETFRVNTLNLVVEVCSDRTNFYFGDSSSGNIIPEFTVGWLPDGYELEDQGSDGFGMWMAFQNSEDKYIKIKYILSEGTVLSLDTENAKTENVKINGLQATLIRKGDILQLVWATNDKNTFLWIYSVGVALNDVINVASNLVC